MKPTIENVFNEYDFNWQVKEFHCRKQKVEFSCSWHYHSEYELVLYRDPKKVFNGRYFAGDSIGEVEHNTMLLYGPGLPHLINGHIDNIDDHGLVSVIMWFRPQWVESLLRTVPELKNLRRLLTRAAHGLKFSPETGEAIYHLFKDNHLKEQHHQIVSVLQALCVLADDVNSQKLSVSPYGIHDIDMDAESTRRVEQARRFIERNYAKPIKLKDLCTSLHISESSAYRLFERHFLETFSEHLKRFRIGKACDMLLNSEHSVALIAEQTGFNNLSNFNRQFKSVKGATPSQFRAQYI